MKINVSGSIIDTEDIYEISSVYSVIRNGNGISSRTNCEFGFHIRLSTKSGLQSITCGTELDYEKIRQDIENKFKSEIVSIEKIERYAFITKKVEEHFEEITEKVNKIRQELIDLWSENQSEIPTFEIVLDD